MADLERMRGLYSRVVPWLRAQGWTDADVADLADSMKSGVAKGGDDLEAWSRWLEEKAAELDALGVLCRQAEGRIRAYMERIKRKAA